MSNITLTSAQKRIILREARKDYVRLQNMLENYREACEDDRRNGHRPHHCVHGVNMWVDYDCACYQCEDGETLYDLEAKTPADLMRETLEAFRYEIPALHEKFRELSNAYLVMNRIGNRITSEKTTDLFLELSKELYGRWSA